MADQVRSHTAAGVPQDQPGAVAERGPAGGGEPEVFHGRAVSWLSVSIIVVGFIVGGLALVFGPIWWLFWVAAGIVVVGGLLGAATRIMEDWY